MGSSSKQSVTEPLLRILSPIPIEDDDDDDDYNNNNNNNHNNERNIQDTEAWCTHLGERIYHSTSVLTKITATILSFMVLGLITSTPGVILPHLEEHYHLNDLHASLIFLVAPAGYLVGARLNDPIHRRLGQRGIAVIAPTCQVVFTLLVGTFHSSSSSSSSSSSRGGAGFPVFLGATVLGNIGNGLLDGSWCAWAGGLGNSSSQRRGSSRTNTVQGLLHGGFSIGAGLGPLLAGTMFSVWHVPWWMWYYVLLGAVIIQGIVLWVAFRFEDGSRYRAGLEKVITGIDGDDGGGGDDDARRRSQLPASVPPPPHARTIFRYTATWICAAYFLVYVGTEAAISGWVVTFMRRVRHASPYLASLSSSGFWIGMAAGRLTLGVVTDKLGVRRATAAYLTLAILAQGILATIDVAAVSVGMVTVMGLFLGPLFPSGIVVLAQLLPKELLVGAVSFVAAVGQVGGAMLPFILGSLAQTLGIYIFQAFILGMLTVTLLVWILFPASPRPVPHAMSQRDVTVV